MKQQFRRLVILTIVDSYTSIFQYNKPLPKYLIHLEFKMLVIFILKKEPLKKYKFLIFLKGRYLAMSGSIDMNFGMF